MKKRWIGWILAALLLCGTAWAAAAEEEPSPVPRLELPEFSPDLWPAPRPFDSEEAAVAYAREIFSSPLLQQDVADAAWTAEWTVIEDVGERYVQYRHACRVTGVKPDGREMSVLLYAGNGGVRLLFSPDNPIYDDTWAFEPCVQDAWREQLWQFALQLLEAMEPGITDTFSSLRDDGDVLIDGARIVQLEFIIDEEFTKPFRLQVYPEIRLLETYTGRG